MFGVLCNRFARLETDHDSTPDGIGKSNSTRADPPRRGFSVRLRR
jgi:hypothetical protein